MMDFKKYLLVIWLCLGVAACCQAEPEALLPEPESVLVEPDPLPISVAPDLLVAPNTSSERGMLKTMKDINNAALNKAISDVVNKLLGAVIFISAYYACYGAIKGGKALRDFLVS